MIYLLDTHVLLFWLLDDRRLSRKARTLMANGSSSLFVSAASAWELSTKVRIGKLPGAERLAQDLPLWLAESRIRELPISVLHAQKAGAWPQPHRDPFDRMLAAQAALEDMTLVSNDAALASFGVTLFW